MVWVSINILNSIAALFENWKCIKFLWTKAVKYSNRERISLPIFHFSCSQQSATECLLTVSLSQTSRTFLRDTAELERGGTHCVPEFWRYWTVLYHTDFSWLCEYSRLLVAIARPWLQWHFPFKWRLIPQRYYFQVGIFPQSLISLYGITFLLVTKCIFLHWLFFSKKQLNDAWNTEKYKIKFNLRNNHLNYKVNHIVNKIQLIQISLSRAFTNFYTYLPAPHIGIGILCISKCNPHEIWSILAVANFCYSLLTIKYLLKIA